MALNDTIESDVSAMSPPSADEGVRMRNLTLQTLEVFLPYKPSPTGRLFYSKDKFDQSINLWKGKFFIYSPSGRHIDWESYLSNPAKELQKYDARIVGVNDETKIPQQGSPRLDSWGWFWDDEVNELADDGKLGLSTDFNVVYNMDEMIGAPTPNYILVFPADAKAGINPVDIGSRVLNSSIDQKLEDKMDDEMKGAFGRLEGLLSGFIDAIKGSNVKNSAIDATTLEVAPAVPVEYLNQIETMKAENEKASAELASIREQYDALKATEAQRAEADKAAEMQKLEATWQTTIMPKLPAALLVDEAKAAEIKKLAIEHPLEFMQQYGDQINRVEINVANSTVTGQTVQNSNVENDKDLKVGSYNAVTGVFE